MNEENVTLDSKKMAELALDYKELRNMTLINDGEVLYIKNSKGEAVNIHDYTKYDYLKDLNFGKTSEFLRRCKNKCNSERPCEECLRDRMYLSENDELELFTFDLDGKMYIALGVAEGVEPKYLAARAVLEELGITLPEKLKEKIKGKNKNG